MDDPVLVDDLRPSKPPPASFYDDMFDSYFNDATEPPEPSPKDSSSSSTPPPVFDKPVFDDDPDAVNPFSSIPLFGGGGSGGDGEDDFLGDLVGAEKSVGRREPEAAGFDDELLTGLEGSGMSTEPVRVAMEPDLEAVGFDDFQPELGESAKPAPPVEPENVVLDGGVIHGFGGSTNHHDSARDDPMTGQGREPTSSSKMSASRTEEPFVILGATTKSEYSSFGLFSDHLDNIRMPAKSESTKVDAPANTSGRFQGSDMFAGFPNDMPSFSFASVKEGDATGRKSVDSTASMSHSSHILYGRPVQQGSTEAAVNILPEMNTSEPSIIHEVPIITGFQTLNPFAMDDGPSEETKFSKMPDDVWLTVSDITLVTQPTSAPPPSRPPPLLTTKQSATESVTTKTYPHHYNQGYHHPLGSADTLKSFQIDELEDFFAAKPANLANGHPRVLNHEETEQYSSTVTASFMGQSDLGDSKGMDQGAFGSVFTSSQYQQGEIDVCDHKTEKMDEKERLENERRQREHDEEQRRAERERIKDLERERENVRQREQEEQRRREQERQARQAVEKAIREARERAAVEARRRAERAAVQKAAAEARERAAVEAKERAAKADVEAKERAAAAEATERAAAETRERAAVEARERAAIAAAEAKERAAAEARERAAAEAREKAAAESQKKAAAEAQAKAERAAVEKAAAEARRRAERAVFERVAAEARQRAANEARERAAAEARARENQQKTTSQPDLESFFGMPSRSSSVPRSQTASMNPFDVHPHGTVRTSSGQAFMQPSSSNPIDDLSSIFGAPSSSAVFQELDGESEERRKARLERHQRTMERAAKALAEKNERDLQVQREQEERHRIGETLDFEIKRWAAGKEGNLRALLSTLQYILWPDCGWRPVSLTDLITAASVKKEYRKATLCIHPDKVQQRGANLQQKYIAEKVFDLLKEAWNKFNSEELF